jgi:hypothetical protein
VRLLLACILALLTGCARGTTLPEAAGRLESDSRGVLDEGARRLGPPGARPAIALNDRRTCPNGRARRLWRGSIALRHPPGTRTDLDGATDVAIGLARARGYRLEGPPAFTRRTRVFTMTRAGLRLVFRLRGGGRSYLSIASSTPCLPGT